MIAGALLRFRDRAVRAVATRGATVAGNQAESSLNHELSVTGLQHARDALQRARPIDPAQLEYRTAALQRLDNQIRARVKHSEGSTPHASTVRDAGHGPCTGCAQVRHAFATVADAIAAALAPSKPGPIQARIEAQQAGERGPLQTRIDEYHGGRH